MRSERISFRAPRPLRSILTRICKEQGYKNLSALMIGCCVVTIQNERRRTWVREISNAKPTQQDYIIKKMLAFPLDRAGMMQALKSVRTHKRAA